MIKDDEIRAAFLRLADRAPHPARVQARLQRSARAHRQRRALLVAGGVAVGAGVTGGIVTVGARVLRGPDFGPDVRTAGNLSDPVAWPAQAGNVAIALRYRPQWLPEGFVELERATTVDAEAGQLRQRRAWYPEGTAPQDLQAEQPHIYLDLVPATHWEIAGWRSPVRINGARGGLGPEGSTPVLLWEAGGGLNLGLSVSGFPDSRATALAIARSIVPDAVSTVEIALSFGWRPEVAGGVLDYETGPGGSSIGLVVDRTEVLNVTIDRQTSDAAYETRPVPLRGGTGRLFAGGDAVIVWLTLPDGRLLQASAERAPAVGVFVTEDDVRRMVDELHIGPRPANEWIGTR
jgi:hypothetical protein